MNKAIEFKNNEENYLDWIQRNTEGFVLNIRSNYDPNYMVLHKAHCYHVNNYSQMDTIPGGFTERKYIKICSLSLGSLNNWVKKNGRIDGSFSKKCSFCYP